MSELILTTEALLCGDSIVIACDARCDKAFGRNERPIIIPEPAEDGFEWASDDEIGEAPAVSQETAGGVNKPADIFEAHNLWCGLVCERSVIVDPGDDVELPDFSQRIDIQ